MAYDLVVGKSNQIKDRPLVVGKIEFEEYPTLSRLLKKRDTSFLRRLTNLFQDQSFGLQELQQAQIHLFELILTKLEDDERAFIYKMLAILSFALHQEQSLHGVAD